jgi:4-hydroxybenzoate polyprenyltransferase
MAFKLFEKIKIYLEMIKFSHTLFALPFALTGMLLAENGFPGWTKFLLILLAMVSGRTTAMLLNRVIDAEIDRKNPRTRDRAIPSGLVDKKYATLLAFFSGFMFLLSAYLLNWLCFILAPIPLAVFVIYPYTKRFTSLSHFILGAALGMAPVGAWIAVKGVLPDLPALILGTAVLFWTAGFDILYAILDIEFDRKEGLRSVPALLDVKGALFVSRILHLLSFILLGLLYPLFELGGFYIAGLSFIALLLIYEHSLVKPGDLSRLNTAFFNVNASISIIVLVSTTLDILRSRL